MMKLFIVIKNQIVGFAHELLKKFLCVVVRSDINAKC